MEIKHTSAINMGLNEADINKLFDGLIENNLDNIKAIERFWTNAWELKDNIVNKSDLPTEYKDKLFTFGIIGEFFMEAIIRKYPSNFGINPNSVILPPNIKQKGYDATATGTSGRSVWIQMKFKNPYEKFGEDKKEGIRQLDSFISATVWDGKEYYKKDRIFITTARGLYYELEEIGYAHKMCFKVLSDLNQIIGQDVNFWPEFKQALLEAIKIIKLPEGKIELRNDQKEDVEKITNELDKNKVTTYVAPTGSGKTEVAIEVIKNILEKPNENNSI